MRNKSIIEVIVVVVLLLVAVMSCDQNQSPSPGAAAPAVPSSELVKTEQPVAAPPPSPETAQPSPAAAAPAPATPPSATVPPHAVPEKPAKSATEAKAAQAAPPAAAPSTPPAAPPAAAAAPAAPKPSGEDVLRLFFNLIKQHKTAAAVDMLHPGTIRSPGSKADWKKTFDSIKTVKGVKITPWNQSGWTADEESYQVELKLLTNPDDPNNPPPIPHNGWEDGANTRWTSVKKAGDVWKVTGFATGPG